MTPKKTKSIAHANQILQAVFDKAGNISKEELIQKLSRSFLWLERNGRFHSENMQTALHYGFEQWDLSKPIYEPDTDTYIKV